MPFKQNVMTKIPDDLLQLMHKPTFYMTAATLKGNC